MDPIKCKEPNCDCVLVNPCGTVQALFGFRKSLEESAVKMSAEDKEKHLAHYNDSIKAIGLEEPEKTFRSFRKLMTTAAKPSKHFVLKCIKGHVYTYEISCDPNDK